jgi:ABC-type multidrug transport system fused ATPase/permease subunit
VLILDEATNAVDSVTELAIQETIEKLIGRCTIVVVAHRLTTIRQAAHVVVLSNGRVVETGVPQELALSDGAFSRLYGADDC